MVRIISALLVSSLSAPYGVVFSAPGKEKVLFLGVLDKDNAWISNESLKWFKMSLLSPKYEWTSVENSGGALSPSDFQKIAETHKQENASKIVYGKINGAELSKRRNGASVSALFYIYDTAAKTIKEIALNGISPQKPGYRGSDALLYNEALKDLSAQLVTVLEDENTIPTIKEKKLASKKHRKKFLGLRLGWDDDDNVFGSDLLDMIMGAGLLYMVFFHRTGGSSGSSSSSSSTSTTTSCQESYQKVNSWSGTGIKTTESFTITGSTWRINHSNSGGGVFQVYVYKSNNELVTVAANTTQSGSDTSHVNQSGSFYLTINAANTNWTVEVEDFKCT